jgi:hypothetical protein
VSWVEAFAVLAVSHLVGDFIFQTDWQASWKHGGLGRDPVRRRALRDHLATYTASFLPALAWIAAETSVARAVLIGVVIAVPHWIQDDGRLLDAWMAAVKGTTGEDAPWLRIAVDQSFHLVFLFGAALLAAS